MRYHTFIAVVVITGLMLTGAYIFAQDVDSLGDGEKKLTTKRVKGKNKVEIRFNNKKMGDSDSDDVKVVKKGRIEVWVNGKKIKDESFGSDRHSDKKWKKFELELDEFLKKNMPGNDDSSESKVVENDMLISVVTRNGRHFLQVNGVEIEIPANDSGELVVSMKVSTDGKALVVVNGKEMDIPETEGPFIFRKFKSTRPGFRFEFDGGDLPAVLRKHLKDMFGPDNEFKFDVKPFSKKIRRHLRRFRDRFDDEPSGIEDDLDGMLKTFEKQLEELERQLKGFDEDGEGDSDEKKSFRFRIAPRERLEIPDDREKLLLPRGDTLRENTEKSDDSGADEKKKDDSEPERRSKVKEMPTRKKGVQF